MSSLCRHSPTLAAALSIVVVMAASPVSASDPVAGGAVVTPVAAKQNSWLVGRRAVPSAYPGYRRRLPLPVVRVADECAGTWCGHQFVLMLGIGY